MQGFTAAPKAAAVAAALLLGACDSNTGPKDVKLGRDVCEMCGMIISDPKFVSELRLSDGELHKFDDVGDAVNWLASRCASPSDAKEFWVMDSASGKAWLDARTAYYRAAQTPMNYGFGAVAARTPDSVPFETMRARALRKQFACQAAPKTESSSSQ